MEYHIFIFKDKEIRWKKDIILGLKLSNASKLYTFLFVLNVESAVIARFSTMHRVALPHVAHVVTHIEYMISESPFDHVHKLPSLHSFLIISND